MLNQKNVHKLVFLDIETKAKWETLAEVPAKYKMLFLQQWDWLIEQIAHRHYLDSVLTDKKKADHELSYTKAQDEVWLEKAHLSPETAEIICISAGMIMEDFTFRCASFSAESEKEILIAFLANPKSFIHQDNATDPKERKYIVCFNGKQFDIPFLCKRILYNGLDIPAALNLEGMKPWEILHIIDPKESLKFGGMDAPSLEMLCTILGVETAQDKFKVEASELAGNHKNKAYNFIKDYCEYDVYALAQCYLKIIRSKEHPTGINQQLTKI